MRKVQKNKNKKPSKAAKGVHRKGKGKMAYANDAPSYAPKPKNPTPPKKDNPAKDVICHHYSGVGCGTHICNTTQGLRGSKKLNPLSSFKYLKGNVQPSTVKAIGNYHLCLPSGLVIVLNNCHYAPSITRRIILVSHFVIPRDGVYEIEMSCSNTNDSSMYVVSNKRAKLNLDSSLLWHCRLGHISKKRIEKLQHDGLLNSTDIESLGKCVSCMSGKMARKPYSHQVERAKDLLGLIHTDVCGPFRIVSRQGANYFVTFTDDFSRYGYVYLLKHKHEVFETFKVFQKEVENQLGKTIKSLRSDRGGEYISQEFLDHLKEHGIIAHRTPPNTPQHNGVLERRNRTLLDMVRSMMSQTTLPKSFWDYALESVARILNMVPTKKVNNTPYEIWHGQAPKLSYLKVWGYEALVKRDTLTKPDKLEPRSLIVRLAVANNREELVLLPQDRCVRGEYSLGEYDGARVRKDDRCECLSSIDSEDDQEIDEPQSDINPIHRSTRTKRAPDRMCLYIDAEEHELGDLDNDVWELIELPSNAKTVGHKWLFKKKTDMEGAVHTFKSRLVAKGFTQTYGVDYEETFSPVADIRAIRILIAIAAFYNYEIWQMDVKTAFLNGHLSEEVYMTQPKGFVNPKYPNHKRSIYGLKQASRQWNKRFDDEIKKFGFTQNRDEPCVYQKASGSYVTFLILYVDDILIMGNNIPMLQDVKSYLGKCFAMKDLENFEKILHGEFQTWNYPNARKAEIELSDGASTPAEKRRMSNVPYASAVGSIMYVVRCTRPDVAFAQNITSRFQQNPGELHWTTVKNILKYLRNTKDIFLVYGGDMKRELKVSCYTDAGYLTDVDDLKSQTRYVFVLNGGVVDWKSTKQSIFATSSTDVEYIAAFDASKEAVWIRKFISGLNVVPTIKEPITMYCDNTGAIAIANDHGVTKGARHFRAKVHYLRETIELGDVRIEKVDTDDNLADPFTKALAFPKHSELTRKIGLIPASSLMQVRVLLDVSIASMNADCYTNSQVGAVEKCTSVSYTQCFQELALLCGRMFLEVSDEVEKYVGGLPDMIQGSVMASKPKTMQEAIEIANDLMDQKIRTFADRQAENKRNLDDNSRNNQNQQQPFKKSPAANANANNKRNSRVNQRGVICFECGVQGHYKKDCPKLKNKNQGNQARNGGAQARAYAVGNVGKNPNANVVTGTDIAKILRKRLKSDKHGHGNGRAHKEPGECYQKSTVVNSSTDIAKISRKRLKPDKHGHGNGRAHKEPGECYQKSTVVNSSQPSVKHGQHKKTKSKIPKSVPQS
ncbi:retrotransposon protein, putative, ty1-copia subclass [Tanacetum coccineum]